MKIFKSLLIAGIAFASLHATAQTADEIIAKNQEAMGGTAKLTALNSVKMSGSMSAQGQDFPITITKSHLKGMRVDLDIMGQACYQIITPEKGSMFFPIQGMTEPKEMDADALKSGQSQLDLQGSLTNYKEKGKKVELIGKEKVDGADAFKLKLTDKDGRTTDYFVDAKTYRVVKTAGKASMNGQEMDIETSFSDFKQNADGYWFPYTMTTQNGPMTFEKIETNIKVDESIFKN